MYTIKVEHAFDAAHHLPEYVGKCQRVHGHRWRVEVEWTAKIAIDAGSRRGMIEDFANLKSILREAIDEYDHRDLNDCAPFCEHDIPPTAEMIAIALFTRIDVISSKLVPALICSLKSVTVHEGPGSSVKYEPSQV